MLQTQADVERFWSLFKDSVLWSSWPEFQSDFPQRLDVIRLRSGEVLFRPGDPPDYLYLVGSGVIKQTMQRPPDPAVRAPGQRAVVFEQELRAGEHFGQQALFGTRHETTAVAVTDAILYRMGAAQLRVAMEKNQELYEFLLSARRAARMRSIPLFRDLSDSEVRRLAQIVTELVVPEGESLSLEEKPGIWIVDYGQVSVGYRGAVRADATRRISAGNFFMTGADSEQFGTSVLRAKTTLPTRFFHIPSPHASRLIAGVLDVEELVSRPLEIEKHLRKVPLLSRGLTERHRRSLAQICSWEFIPADQNVTTQGTVGHAFVMLRRGMAVVNALDDHGRLRPRNALGPGDFYGESSLLEGKPRDATVRSVGSSGPEQSAGVEVLILDRRDLQLAIDRNPRLWSHDVPLVKRVVHSHTVQQPFEWMKDGEIVRWQGRAHLLWLIFPEALLFGLTLVLFIAATLAPADLVVSARIAALVLTGLGIVPFAAWTAINYFDDYYVVTSLRVSRRDRQLLMYEARVEAPIDMVQDLTIDTHLLGRIFGYGELSIRTAAKVGSIRFDHVPQPESVRDTILLGRAEAQAAIRGHQREVLRSGLMQGLEMALTIPHRGPALGKGLSAPRPSTWQQLLGHSPAQGTARVEMLPGSQPGLLSRKVAAVLPERWRHLLFGPAAFSQKPLPGQFVWRKHWLNLVRRAGPPFAFFISLIIGGIFLAGMGSRLPASLQGAWVLPLIFLCLADAAWFAWEFADYHNDVYVVTDDKIIDIEQRPLGLSSRRREGGLDRVQNVNAVQDGLWANLFDYGNVLVQTAAADEGYDFVMVGNPKLVQSIIFQKLDAFRRRQEERRTQSRQNELIEGLEVYHELQAGRARRPDGSAPRGW